MRFSASWILAAVLVSVSLCSCERGPSRRETFPVTGRVTVDGQAVSFVCITAHDQNPTADDPNYPVARTGITGEDGTFQMNGYEKGDGLPTGNYVLTFAWIEPKGLTPGPDKLGKRYQDPAQSTFKCKVENSSVDLGTIELTTK